jgi:hypothetical protein
MYRLCRFRGGVLSSPFFMGVNRNSHPRIPSGLQNEEWIPRDGMRRPSLRSHAWKANMATQASLYNTDCTRAMRMGDLAANLI